MAKDVLELSTESSAPVVAIDGVKYQMIDPGDMGALPAFRASRLARRWHELGTATQFDEQHAAELDQIKDEIFRLVLPGVPDDVVKKVKTKQKASVAALFFAALVEARPDLTPEPSADAQTSNASTGEPQANG